MVLPVTVGLDIAKNVFHAYGVDAEGEKVLSRKLRRAKVEAFFATLEPCLVGIEACATAHHWARTIENTIRAHLAEFGITKSIGRIGLSRLIDIIISGDDDRITDVARAGQILLPSFFPIACRLSVPFDTERPWHLLTNHRLTHMSWSRVNSTISMPWRSVRSRGIKSWIKLGVATSKDV